jgi:hypothetical protein
MPPPPPPPAEHRVRVWPFIAGAAVVALLLAAGVVARRASAPPPEVWLESRVRTEPADADLRLDGLQLAQGEVVRFRDGGPYGTLSAARGCREVERTLAAADAGGEIVLALQPTELAWTVDPGVPGARLTSRAERARLQAVGRRDPGRCRARRRARGARSASLRAHPHGHARASGLARRAGLDDRRRAHRPRHAPRAARGR